MHSEVFKAAIYAALTETKLDIVDGQYLTDVLSMEQIYDLGDGILDRLPPTQIEQVTEFQDAFEHPISETPTVPHRFRANFRLTLMFEEMHELAIAAGCELEFMLHIKQWIHNMELRDTVTHNVDIVETLDALVDLQYFLTGTIIEFGMQDIFDYAFQEVHRSNMTKFCDSEEIAKQTVEDYLQKTGVLCTYEHKEGYGFVVKRKQDLVDDGKIIKSVQFSEPELAQLVFDELNKGTIKE